MCIENPPGEKLILVQLKSQFQENSKEGESASNIIYEVKIQSPDNSRHEIAELINHVDRIAEIHNTLRKGASVTLKI